MTSVRQNRRGGRSLECQFEAGVAWLKMLQEEHASDLRILRILRCALQRERQRGLSGHWAYDLARHEAMLEVYRRRAYAYAAGRCGLADQS